MWLVAAALQATQAMEKRQKRFQKQMREVRFKLMIHPLKRMNAQGYNSSGTKCATKFQALKRIYKIVSDANKKSGNSRKDWEYCKIMNDMFGDKPWMKPLSVAESMVEEEEDLQNKNDKEPE